MTVEDRTDPELEKLHYCPPFLRLSCPLSVYFRGRPMSHSRQSVLTSRTQNRMVRLARGPARPQSRPCSTQPRIPQARLPRLFRTVVFLPAANSRASSPHATAQPHSSLLSSPQKCSRAVHGLPHLVAVVAAASAQRRATKTMMQPVADARRTLCHSRPLSWLAQLTYFPTLCLSVFLRSDFYYYMIK